MFSAADPLASHIDLLATARGKLFGTISPIRRGSSRTVSARACAEQRRSIAPEHKRLNRYGTMTLDDIRALPVADIAA